MATAQQIFEQAFNRFRDPRSPEYKAGCLALLQYKLGEVKTLSRCPYLPETAQSDAWYAGNQEGHSLLRSEV